MSRPPNSHEGVAPDEPVEGAGGGERADDEAGWAGGAGGGADDGGRAGDLERGAGGGADDGGRAGDLERGAGNWADDQSISDGLVELVIGAPAAGGGCVAHLDEGRVAFVRHSLPGERVLARITQETSKFVRADAVTILEPVAGRVRPPCRHAGPGRCGGCDWQHAALPVQREMKAALVSEQLRRIAGIDYPVTVEAVAGDDRGLRWRTRVRYSVLPRGRLGFRRHRSHEIYPVDRCLIAAPGIQALAPEQLLWPGAEEVEVFAPEPDGERVVGVWSRRHARVDVPRLDAGLVVDGRTVREPTQLQVQVLGHRFEVSAGVFWQVHAGAAVALGQAMLELAAPQQGDGVADLYSGVGLFSALLADAVGEGGHVLAVERDRPAADDAHHNLAGYPHVDVVCAAVTPELIVRELKLADLAVLDPPRQGAGQAVTATLAAMRRLQRIVYVACDPASFARDLRVLLDAGWALTALRAFDLFPMTEHVELMAVIDRPSGVSP
ncbi:MAG: TRAM domain-containing protein [Acidimicrobiales bacterium]